MSAKERGWIAAILLAILVMVTMDLATDFSDGVSGWHLLVEGSIALASALGIGFLVRGSFALRRSLAEERKLSSRLQEESERWRSQTRTYLEGLSQAIDEQLTRWNLTASEKEIAFLLLKGLSLKEIAAIRKTTEKTARSQSASIYSKAGLGGRSELAAFFLEDLLLPSGTTTSTQSGQ